jgi:uncharacterized membrane protein YtjA (UPF0391 family)
MGVLVNPNFGGRMLRAAITFFIIALVAYLLGAYQVAGLTVDIGRTLLWVFLVLGAISLVVSVISGRNPKQIV